jgi:hypothetical protein
MPSRVATSWNETMRLPYLEVHWALPGPASRPRATPRGIAQRLGKVSSTQSRVRLVRTVLSSPV